MADKTLSWDSQSDWISAQSRQGVISSNTGTNNGETLALGFDPYYLPSGLVGYWSMDQTSGDLLDTANGNDATLSGGVSGQKGPLGTNAVYFDGDDDEAQVSNSVDPAGSGDFTVAAWVNKDSSANDNVDTIFRSGTTYAGTYFLDYRSDSRLGFGYYGTSDNYFSAQFHSGADLLQRQFLVGVAESANELRVYHDGVADTHSISGARPETGSPDIRIGRSANNTAPRYFTGHIGIVMLWDRALSDSEVQSLYDTFNTGSLTTDTQTATGSATSLETYASVPSGTSVSVTVTQDTGSATNTEQVAVDDGNNTYSLSSFEDAESDFSLDISLSNDGTDSTITPTLQAATLGISSAETGPGVDPVGHRSFSVGGLEYDVPLYDHADLDDPSPHVRAENGQVGGFYSVPATDSPLQWSYGGTGDVYGALLDESQYDDGGGDGDGDGDGGGDGGGDDGTTLIAGFEDLDDWGVTSTWQLDGTHVTEGSSALYSDGSSYNTAYSYPSQYELSHYPQVGDTILFDFYPSGGQVVEFNFARQDADNRLAATIQTGSSGEVYLMSHSGGSASEIAYTTTDIAEDRWLTAEIEWGTDSSDNEIVLNVLDSDGTLVESVSGTHSDSHSGNGISFVDGGSSGSERWVDNLRIGSLESTPTTTYYTDFSEYTVGSVPDDWTLQWQSDSSNWSVENNSSAEGGTVLRATGDSTDREALQWNTVGTGSDLEVYGKTELNGANSSYFARHIVRGGTDGSGNELGYLTQIQTYENKVALAKYDTSGTYVELDAASMTLNTGDVVNTRLRANGTTIQAKVWHEGDSEPSSWTVSATDSDHSSGWVGTGTYQDASDTDWYEFGAATGGDTAPTQ